MKKYLSLVTALAISSLSANMNVKWSKEYRVLDMNSTINSISILPNGNVVSVGQLNGIELIPEGGVPPEIPDFQSFIVKHDSTGNQLWFTSFGTELLPDNAIKVFPTNDDKFLVIGSTVSAETSIDISISKFEQNGTIIWEDSLKTTGRDLLKDAVIDNMGNIYIAGVTDGNFSDANGSLGTVIDENIYNSFYSSFVIKVDTNGNLLESKQFEGDFNYGTDCSSKKIHLRINEINETEIYVVRDQEVFSDYNMSINILDENLSTLSSFSYDNTFNGYRSNVVSDFDFKTEENGTLSLFLAIESEVQKVKIQGNNLIELAEGNTTTDSYSQILSVAYNQGTDSLYATGYTYKSDGTKAFISKFDTNSMTTTSSEYFGKIVGESTYGQMITPKTIQVAQDSSIFISGLLHNMTMVETNESNFSGSGAFLTKIIDDYSILDLVTGWNLVSGNIKKESLPQGIVAVYKYGSRYPLDCEYSPSSTWYCEKVWSAFSPNTALNSTLHNLADIPDISEIKNSDGLWIYADSNISINAGYNDTNISTFNYPEGWSLNGIGVEINASIEVRCADENNHSKVVWGFENNNWAINTQDNSFFSTVNRFDMIQANSGFWVDCKFVPFGGFQDLNLSSCINVKLGHIDDNETYIPLEFELLGINEVNCSNQVISTIDGIERLNYITLVNLSSNQISNINSLHSLTQITDLNLSNNSISDLAPLYNLKNLTNLDLSNNPIDLNQIQDLNNSFDNGILKILY